MSNGQQCCLVGICCPAGSNEQREAWVRVILHERPHLSEVAAQEAANRVLRAHLDFSDVIGLIDSIPPAA